MAKYKPYFHKESGITFKDFNQVREYIWETRDHKSELTGEPLLNTNHAKWHWQFLHVLGRNHTYWVLNPDNVLLGTPEEHDKQETFEVFNEKKEELTREYYREYYNKEF